MITERDPTPEELTKRAKSERWNCVAAALFAITYGGLGLLEVFRGKGPLPFSGYALLFMGVCWVVICFRSVRRYKAMA